MNYNPTDRIWKAWQAYYEVATQCGITHLNAYLEWESFYLPLVCWDYVVKWDAKFQKA